MKLLKLSEIRRDDSAQPRAMLNTDHVKDLADSLEDGSDLTPVDVFHDGSSYWLADGFHRWSAYHRAKREEIPVTVHEGQLRDAVLYSITANAKHAVLKLTRDEKRASVTRLLRDKEWAQWSNREIGRRAGVDHKTVGAIREEVYVESQEAAGELSGEIPQIEGRKVKRGNSEYTMQVKPKPEPTLPPAPPVTTYRPPVTPDEPEEDDRPDYDPDADDDGLELTASDFEDHRPPELTAEVEAEIVSDAEEDDEPYIPPHVSNPRPSTFQVRKVPDPKPKEPPFVLWLTLLGKVRGQGHRSLIEALNSVENRTMEHELDVHVDDLIEMLRASKKQAQIERKTMTV